MRVARLRSAVRASRAWPLYTQLLVAGGVIIAASVLVIAVTSDGEDAASAVPTTSTGASTTADPGVTPTVEAPTTVASAPTPTNALPTAPAPTLSPPTSSAGTSPVTSAVTPVATDASGGLALDVLHTIPVQLEHRGGYDRDLFAVWSDLDDDGCDTRDEVLRDESLDRVQSDPRGCPVIAGRWYSAYDDQTIEDPTELDIDHVVALKEAWDSGAWEWSPDRRIAYANDQTDPRTLAAVSAVSNRDKGDRDPSNWLPIDSARCRYLSDWISIKARWGLSMDQSEWGRIENLLEGPCAGTPIDA